MVAAEFERWLDLAISKLTGCIGIIGNNNTNDDNNNNILGLYRDNGKENGNYYNGLYSYIGYSSSMP